MNDMTQTQKLAHRIHGNFVHKKPGSNAAYISHGVIQQHITRALGVPPSFEIIELIRGDVDGFTKNGKKRDPLVGVVVGCLAKMTAIVDGEQVSIVEPGEVEHPHNDRTDGARAKKAASDAYKRCGLRLGAGLQLWCLRHDEYVLPEWLATANPDELVAPPEAIEGQELAAPEEVEAVQPDWSESEVDDAGEVVRDTHPLQEEAPADKLEDLHLRSRLLEGEAKDGLKSWLDGEGLVTASGGLAFQGVTVQQAMDWDDELEGYGV